MISHFTISATDLMAAFLVMSGLAMLIVLVATSLFAASMSVAGTSLVFSAASNLVSFFLSKLWWVPLHPMLALYSGIGGGAASAIATAEMFGNKTSGVTQLVEALIVALVGAVSLSGSLIAWTKINGFIGEPLWIWARHALTPVVVVMVLALGGCVTLTIQAGANRSIATPELIYWLLGCALLFGALITLPLRRAQMPILISLYSALIGLAIGLEGFILGNQALLIVGIVIGTARAVFVTLLMVEYYRPRYAQ